MAAAVAGVERGGGGSDDAWSSLQKISIISSLDFLLLYFLLIIILDLKLISIMLPPNSPFCLRVSAHGACGHLTVPQFW